MGETMPLLLPPLLFLFPLHISISGTHKFTPGRTFQQLEFLQLEWWWVANFLAQDVVRWGWLVICRRQGHWCEQ